MAVGQSQRYCDTGYRWVVDMDLEHRGHKFARYADDCNIYVASRGAGRRVLESISAYVSEVLKLNVNESKSAVGRPWNRSFPGYSVTSNKQTKLKPSKESISRFKGKVKALGGTRELFI